MKVQIRQHMFVDLCTSSEECSNVVDSTGE